MLLSSTVNTTCPYCGVGCGVSVRLRGERRVEISGSALHPANFGRLCSKGSALGDTVGLEGRLLYPMIHGERTDWDSALETVASGFRRVIDRHGPDAVALYVSGQLLTEDYYVANKLAKGFLGTANIDTNSRLCMSSAVAGHKRAFGADTVPCDYGDLEAAELVVLVGSNTAWCHPVVYQRIVKAHEEQGGSIIVIDPRRTATCDQAELFLPLKPGTDTILFNGLLAFLHDSGVIDRSYIEAHTEGYTDALQAARAAGGIEQVSRLCGLEAADVEKFYRRFAASGRVVTLFSQGVNQSSRGTDKVNAIINCHLATGRIGKTGAGPFSITGQPNAMGGREVGGLANQLAAHMDFDHPEHIERVRKFWRAPNMAQRPGLKAVDLFNAIDEGKVKAVWIMATNPVVSLPDAERARAALKKCELVVVSDCIAETDTTACAQILLPATGWGEKDGTVTNSERRISRQRPFLAAPGEARHDWWIMTEIAHRLGFREYFPYAGAADIFREHAALSAYENNGTRDFDIGALADISDVDYERLEPLQWPYPKDAKQERTHLFADGRFFTPSGKANFVAIADLPVTRYPTSADYPFSLNTGRIRDQWHTMTRSGLAPRLNAHLSEPFVQINPADAAGLGIEPGGLVRVESRWGRMLGRVMITADVRPGDVFAPIHWSETFANASRVDAVVNPVTDPVSGEPEFKHTPVRVAAYKPAWHGFILAREPVQCRFDEYWVQVKGEQFWRYELAGERLPNWNTFKESLLAVFPESEWLQFMDAAAGRHRAVLIRKQRLEACLFIGPDPALPGRGWLASMFGKDLGSPLDRLALLAGIPAEGGQDPGHTVCSCFGVGINSIRASIHEHKLMTAAAIGVQLKAGTNCGSCIPELKRILAEEAAGAPISAVS
jgi:assimilatory nitrate reductase catalytic subunit